ncbi:MAG: hypothetical protein ACD_46C00463G0007 [uncultured bacterium]|nr:MAG: hypothetical protein ACD_46C00463G0007 [uncultured bacterium]
MSLIYFASDNYAGIHPEILNAIEKANQGYATAYGDDEQTKTAIGKFREQFGDDIDVFFVFNGTAANVTSLIAMNNSYQAVICADSAHIQMDECGAPEKFCGGKLLLVPTNDGKLTPENVVKHIYRIGDQHHVQPGVISISQTTEYGTVYTPKEVRALANFAHEHQMYLHMDGARICNAAAALNVSLSTVTKESGVDVLSFGGTKNGLMIGEAVVFFNRSLAKNFLFIRKQSMQLASKMRFISAQFSALLSNNLWHRNAAHANAMATLLAEKIADIPHIKITQAVQANAIFAKMPRELINQLYEKFFFYIWNENTNEVRIMTSFNTKESDVNAFANAIRSTKFHD